MTTRKKIFSGLAMLSVLMTASVVFGQEAGEAAKEMSLMDMIAQGGWAMYPLGLCSFLLVAIIVVNFRQIAEKKMMPPDLLAQIKSAAQTQNIASVWNMAQNSDTLFARGLSAGLRHIDPEDPASSKPRMEEGIAEAISREESKLSFWMNFLSLIAAISPMLGLLGTVSGMIGAFQKIGAGGMGKPELLASNIGEALITTATGLVIAIPAMFFYFLFRNLLDRILTDAEREYSTVLEDITGTGIAGFVMEEPEPPPAAPAVSADAPQTE